MSVLMGIRMPKQNKNMRSVQVTLERLPATVIDAFKVCAVIRLSKFKTSLEPSPQFNTSAATTALERRAMKEPLLCVKLERLPMKIMNSLLAKRKFYPRQQLENVKLSAQEKLTNFQNELCPGQRYTKLQ